MKRALAISALLVGLATPAFAHRVDEYLQAATLLVSAGRLELSMRLAPGTAVAATVLDSIDINRDGAISETEGRGYGNQVLRDLYVTLDKTPVVLRLNSWRSSTVEELRRGQGEIHFEFGAALPVGGSQRRLVFENRHRSAIAAFLVNALVPTAMRAVGVVNDVTGRGRHTSSSTIRYEVPTGGLIVDTPGVRSFGLAHVNPENFINAFPDVAEAAAALCPRGCMHESAELGCELDAWADSPDRKARVDSIRRLLAARAAGDAY